MGVPGGDGFVGEGARAAGGEVFAGEVDAGVVESALEEIVDDSGEAGLGAEAVVEGFFGGGEEGVVFLAFELLVLGHALFGALVGGAGAGGEEVGVFCLAVAAGGEEKRQHAGEQGGMTNEGWESSGIFFARREHIMPTAWKPWAWFVLN